MAGELDCSADIAYHANRVSYCIDIDHNYVTEIMAEELTVTFLVKITENTVQIFFYPS